MASALRFPAPLLEALARAKILGVRAGGAHRYTGVWVVSVEDRVFVRSWNNQPTGWYQAFRKEPAGSLQVGKQEVAILARPVRSAKQRDAVTRAYAEKYPTKGSKKWVDGFAEPERAAATLELVPR